MRTISRTGSQLLEDETLRQALSQRCRAIALKDYPLELQVQRYLELYRHVLANPCHDVPGSGRFRQAVQEHIDGRRSLTSRASLEFLFCTTSTLQPSVWRGNLWGAELSHESSSRERG